LTQGNSACSELLITFAVANANAPPTIALQQDQRPGKGKELGSLPLIAVPSAFDRVEHVIWVSASEFMDKAKQLK
jgi:hypothetical protein